MSKTGSPDGPNGPDDLDAAFSEIVADLRAEGVGTDPDLAKRTRDKLGKDKRAEGTHSGEHTDEYDEPQTSESYAELAPESEDLRPEDEHDESSDDSPTEPAEERTSPSAEEDTDTGSRGGTAVSDWRSSESDWDTTMLSDGTPADQDEDEHFVPPEPPPARKPEHGTVVSWIFLGAGLLMLIAPGVIGMDVAISLPFGILSLAAGLGMLLLRIKDGPPPGADPDDGSQV